MCKKSKKYENAKKIYKNGHKKPQKEDKKIVLKKMYTKLHTLFCSSPASKSSATFIVRTYIYIYIKRTTMQFHT